MVYPYKFFSGISSEANLVNEAIRSMVCHKQPMIYSFVFTCLCILFFDNMEINGENLFYIFIPINWFICIVGTFEKQVVIDD